MSNTNSEIFDFTPFNRKKGVYYLSPVKDNFEKLYIETRDKENRVLSDEEVKLLPNTNFSYELHGEWKMREQTSERFISYLELNKFDNVLDIGCGNGWFTNLLAQSNADSTVVGVDVNKTELEQATRVFNSNNIAFLYYDIFEEQSQFDRKFDLITLNASVQYFSDFDKLQERLIQFLKPKGEIHILDSPFYKKEEVLEAKERTRLYFEEVGNEELSNFYFHHTFSDISIFETLYVQKNGIKKRLLKKTASPFLWLKYTKNNQVDSVKKGFSKIAQEYEELEENSSLIQYKRKKVRNHLLSRVGEKDSILELNCGTGIDAVYFANKGFSVTATDISEGMLSVLRTKIKDKRLTNKVVVKNRSFLDINKFERDQFNNVFSNFGGLNCIEEQELKTVIKNSSQIMSKGGIITLVIMPKVTVYEWLRIFKGNRSAFRRLKKGGVIANVEGENVRTFYHSARNVKKILKQDFENIQIENIFTVGPAGSSYSFPAKHPILFKLLMKADKFCNKTGFLNGFGDYYIISASKQNNTK